MTGINSNYQTPPQSPGTNSTATTPSSLHLSDFEGRSAPPSPQDPKFKTPPQEQRTPETPSAPRHRNRTVKGNPLPLATLGPNRQPVARRLFPSQTPPAQVAGNQDSNVYAAAGQNQQGALPMPVEPREPSFPGTGQRPDAVQRATRVLFPE